MIVWGIGHGFAVGSFSAGGTSLLHLQLIRSVPAQSNFILLQWKTPKCCAGVGKIFFLFFLRKRSVCVFTQNCLSYKEMKMREKAPDKYPLKITLKAHLQGTQIQWRSIEDDVTVMSVYAFAHFTCPRQEKKHIPVRRIQGGRGIQQTSLGLLIK